MKKAQPGFGPVALALAVAFLVSGCELLNDPEVFDKKFWEGSTANENTLAELGLAELAKGNHTEAEHFFQQAIKKDPNDSYALAGLGILYQNTGQNVRAREMYEAVLAVRPDREQQLVFWSATQTRPLVEIVGYNLALLDNGGGGPGTGTPAALSGSSTASIRSAPTATALIARPAADAAPAGTMLSKGDANIAGRFKILASLRDQALITQQEYAQRRQANIGALLPLTSPPPAAGLDRPVPTAEQISQRLQAIGRSLEMRAMTVAQHASERNMILDALMPSAPVAVANPGPPPQGLMEAADAVRRLEQLKADGLITSDEYAKERAAIERAVQPSSPSVSRSGAGVQGVDRSAAAAPAAQAPRGGAPAVHLASYRSEKRAQDGWGILRRQHPGLLGGLQAATPRVDLGPGKGIYYRLKAGPLADRSAALDLCAKLKAQRVYCEPTAF